MAVLPAALAAALLELSACSARRGEPLRGPLVISDPRVAHGQAVFMAKCNKCHPGGDAGLGPALNNKPLPGFLVRYQARHGMGAMPAFDADELPDKELDDVSAYLEALRGNG
jgi:mono/diheme cytochrome c family protein